MKEQIEKMQVSPTAGQNHELQSVLCPETAIHPSASLGQDLGSMDDAGCCDRCLACKNENVDQRHIRSMKERLGYPSVSKRDEEILLIRSTGPRGESGAAETAKAYVDAKAADVHTMDDEHKWCELSSRKLMKTQTPTPPPGLGLYQAEYE